MAKPNISGELTDVHVDSISIVSKAANKRKFQIFKSANAPADEAQQEQKRFFDCIKAFFLGENGNAGKESVEKGAVADIYNAQDKLQQYRKAIEALSSALGIYDEPEKMERDPAKVTEAVNEFAVIVVKIMSGKDVEKSAEETQTDTGKGEDSMNEEKVNELVKGALDEAMKPLAERIEKLEKAESEKPAAPDSADIEKAVKTAIDAAVAELVKPLTERIEKIEKARGESNTVKDDVEKNDSSVDNIFGGMFD